MAEILPSVVGRPVQGSISSPGGGVIDSGGVAFARELARAGNVIGGVIEEEVDRRAKIKAEEQKLSVTENYNEINIKMNDWENAYRANTKPTELGSYDEKRAERLSELMGEVKNLNPKSLRVLKSNLNVRTLLAKNNQNNYQRQQLDAAQQNANIRTAAESIPVAINSSSSTGQEWESIKISNANQVALTRKAGGGGTRKEAFDYADKTKQELPENFETQSLSKTRDAIIKERDALFKSGASPKQIKDKNTLIFALNSAIITETTEQINTDKILFGRFSNHAKARDIVSMKAVIDNASPEGGGVYKASTGTLKVMNETLKNYVDYNTSLNTAATHSQAVANTAKPLQQTEAELESAIIDGEMKLTKATNKQSAKIQKKAIELYREQTKQYTKKFKADGKIKIDNFISETKKLPITLAKSMVDKLENDNSVNTETITQLRGLLANREKEQAASPEGQRKQNSVEKLVLDAFWGEKINTADEGYAVYSAGGGLGTQNGTLFTNMWNRKDRIIDPKMLVPSLTAAGKTFKWFYENGGIERLQDELTFKKGIKHTPSDYERALSRVMSQQIVIPGGGFIWAKGYRKDKIVTFGKLEDDPWGPGNRVLSAPEIVYEKGWMEKTYTQVYEDTNKRLGWMTSPVPSKSQIERFARESLGAIINNDGDYILDPSRHPSFTVKNYYNLTTKAKQQVKDIKI